MPSPLRFLLGYRSALALQLTALAPAAYAQIGVGTTSPDAKAALDISSTGKGLLIPRMDSASRVAIAPAPDGLMVFQTNGRKGFWYAVSGTWYFIPDKTRAGDNLGNHTATQNLDLGANQLVGNGGTTGLNIDAAGKATIGTVRTLAGDDFRTGLEINNADGLLSTGTHVGNLPPAPINGAGTRLMWLPASSSFRAGYVDGLQWDFANIGDYSVAMGYNTRASGSSSTAFGSTCAAPGGTSFAVGVGCVSVGVASVAMGSFARTNPGMLGRGSFVFADNSVVNDLGTSSSGWSYFTASAANTFNVRCIGGFNFYTSSNLATGVTMSAGGNAWNVVSDSTRKERIRVADGDAFLARIGQMRLGSWNYKQQDPATMRHYGPMAQDFYAAFGHDGVGTIGEPTFINQADFDGVNLIAIQALYRRVQRLEAENTALRRQVQLIIRRLDEYPPQPAAEARR